MTALQIVNEKFPKVTQVIDAKKSISIEVNKQDTTSAKVKNHKECAMAVACKRQLKSCDGAMISLKSAYIVVKDTAYRYNVPGSVAREVISFDRKAGFSPGNYQLVPPPRSNKMNARQNRKYTEFSSHKNTGNGMTKRFLHFTDNVRSRVGSKEFKAES